MLKYGAGVAALGAAGVAGFFLLGGSRGPAETVRAYVTAAEAGNAERANALIHPSSSMDEVSADGTGEDQTDIAIQDTEVVSNTGSRAQVHTTISISGSDVFSDGSSLTLDVELRKYQEEWRLWSASIADFG